MKESGTVAIYALRDPRDNAVRYIGKTIQTLQARLNNHLRDGYYRNDPRSNWIKKLIRLDLRPSIHLLENVPSELWQEAERYWIRLLRDRGNRLTNSTSGGDAEKELTLEYRAKLSAANKGHTRWLGKRHTSETKIKMRRAALGRKHTAQTCAKLSMWHTGQHPTNETRSKISKANKGKQRTIQTRKKMSQSLVGNTRWLGKHHTLQTRAKMSMAHMGNTHWLGKHHTTETRAKMSEARKRSWERRRHKAALAPP